MFQAQRPRDPARGGQRLGDGGQREARHDAGFGEEDVEALCAFVETPAQRAAVIRNAKESMLRYASMYDGICQAAREMGV